MERVTARMLAGLDLLAAALLAVAVTQPSSYPWPAWVAGGAFAACWAAARLRVRVLDGPMEARATNWRAILAMALLLVGYAGVLLTSAAGMWLAFPLMLLQMHMLGPRLGVIGVTATTVAAVSLGSLARGQVGIGYILGPVVGALVSVAIVIGLESLTRVVADRERALQDLRSTRQRLAETERDGVRAEERARLARDIHDTIAQDFAAVELHLRRIGSLVLSDARAAPALAAAQQATADGLAQARRFIAGEPEHQLDGSLADALRRAADRAALDTGGRTRVAVATVGAEVRLPVEVGTELLRIAQSALANVVRHAGARQASVTLTWQADRVLLDVIDDGVGFDPELVGAADARSGFGLHAMRARMRALGGTIGVESSRGDGTAVAVSLPLRPGAPW